MKKDSDAVEPWVCHKCHETVHVAKDVHAYVCRQYLALLFNIAMADGHPILCPICKKTFLEHRSIK
jgi:rubrerythrin